MDATADIGTLLKINSVTDIIITSSFGMAAKHDE